MEFAWLHEFAQEGAGFCMMEWELTLQQVLDELEFQIINQPGHFIPGPLRKTDHF